MLEIKNLQKSYPGFQLDVSMTVPAGQVVGLVGGNGAGKSTTIKSILRLIRPDSGSVLLDGKALPEDLPGAVKQSFGVVLPDSGFSGYLTAADVKSICAAMYDRFDPARFSRLCAELELPGNQPIRTFSTGMKVKLKVAAALCHEAKLLILDEPTAGLDVMVRDTVLDLLRDYLAEDETRSILISSHISSDLEQLCDTLYLVCRGKITFHEDTDVLLSDYAVLRCSEAQYQALDRTYLLRRKKEPYGYACLTAERQFYKENYPGLELVQGGIDELIRLMEKGDEVA